MTGQVTSEAPGKEAPMVAGTGTALSAGERAVVTEQPVCFFLGPFLLLPSVFLSSPKGPFPPS